MSHGPRCLSFITCTCNVQRERAAARGKAHDNILMALTPFSGSENKEDWTKATKVYEKFAALMEEGSPQPRDDQPASIEVNV